MDTIRTVERRRVRRLEQDTKKGILPTNLTQKERDTLHGKPNEENLLYWTSEREKALTANDIERMLMCDRTRRIMLLVTVPQAADDAMGDILGHTLKQFERLPQEH